VSWPDDIGLSNPISADCLAAMGPHSAQAFAVRAEQAVGSDVAPFRPAVIVLRASVPGNG